MKKIVIVGGDGFCSWPTALHLSARGHDVTIIDNLSRRAIDWKLGVESLTPIASPAVRLKAWKNVSGRSIAFRMNDVAAEYEKLKEILGEIRPDVVVHFGEQRAAPYSMRTPDDRRYTVDNNIRGTHNLLVALTELQLDAHLVHLGTMGVYGYTSAGLQIPEGYLNVFIPKKAGGYAEQKILYPTNPGSIYHMTKSLDQLLFSFYAKNDGVRVTDLHQGIVWGTQTPETRMHPSLINRFDYDGDYGTVLNRFLMQAAVGYPLTVNGSGGQTRAFIHITNTVQCIELAIKTPPARGEGVRIMNQITETHRVRDLARMIAEMSGASIDHLVNPRLEAEENDLDASNAEFLALGLVPVTLRAGLMEETQKIVEAFKDRCDLSRIPCRSAWNSELANKVGHPCCASLEQSSLESCSRRVFSPSEIYQNAS